MLFNSYIFWVFFAVVFALYKCFGHRGQNRLLVAASYVFYGFWDWRFCILMLATTVFDFYIAQKVGDAVSPRTRKRWATASILMNLGVLGFFKYFNFFIENAQGLLSMLGLETHPWTLQVILPVGISFYTFQEIGYIIDVYRGDIKPARKFSDFALFISLFPHLVAGPIQHAKWLLPQIQNPRKADPHKFSIGLFFILWGLFKKVVVADNMATIADTIFTADPHTLTGPETIIGIYAFAFQIYGDFSGYSSMAQGIAKWLDYDFMDNFRMPYFSINPSDFWQRWHIGLSTWLRDYLYIPLGGNRGSSAKTYRNLFLTMVIGGFWHGAAWTFIVWGAFHGALLCAYRLFEKPGVKREKSQAMPFLKRSVLMFIMFQFVCLGWLFFRAESMAQVGTMLANIFTDVTVSSFTVSAASLMAFYTVPLMLFEYWLYKKDDLLALLKIDWRVRTLAYDYCVLMTLFFSAEVVHEFIYFQF